MDSLRHIVRRRAPIPGVDSDGRRDVLSSDSDQSRKSRLRVRFGFHSFSFSPVADAAVGVEGALRYLLLERVLGDFGLVDLDAEAGRAAGANEATLLLDGEAFGADILPPGDVQMDALANNVGR